MTIEHFLADPGFQNWARQQNNQDVAFWEAWRAVHPEMVEQMDEARLLLVGLEFHKTPVPAAQKKAAWEALQKQLQQPEARRPMYKSRRAWWAVAASLALLLCAGWWLLRPATAFEIAQTGFAEIQAVQLPDGSTVTLNANSKIQYAKNWRPGQTRKVSLHGEAFFEIKHSSQNEQFIVQMGPAEVDVLGTRFNANARHQMPIVSLVAGKTRIRLAEAGTTRILKPGETAYVNPTTQQIQIKPGETAMQTSWKGHKWIFNNTKLPQVLQRIQDEFGLNAGFVSPELLNKKVSGQVSTREKAVLFRALEVLLDAEIAESEREISIVKKE